MTDTDGAISRGRTLVAEAERKVDNIEKSFFHLTPKSHKYEDAAELFTKAAKQYQLAKSYIDAGNAFIRATDCYKHSNYSQHNIANCYIQAAHNFSKQDVTAGIAAMLKGINIMAEDGKFSTAAKHEKELAEMFETVGDLDNAVKHFEIAAEYYEMEGSKATAAGCLSSVVPLAAAKGDYYKAIDLLEKMCDSYANTLARHSIKDHIIKAGILYLCIPDYVAAEKGLQRWIQKYADFKGTREYNFLSGLVNAATRGNSDEFNKAISEWETISPLDSFKENYLQLAAKKLESGEGEVEDFT
jgi:alpha-soluble NSF attachment protein